MRRGPLVFLLLAGCGHDKGRGLADPDVTYKVPAIKQAADKNDKTSYAKLVSDLDSEDSAVRFYAIEGLRRMTGQTFGYHYYADAGERKPAVVQWHAWLAGQK